MLTRLTINDDLPLKLGARVTRPDEKTAFKADLETLLCATRALVEKNDPVAWAPTDRATDGDRKHPAAPPKMEAVPKISFTEAAMAVSARRLPPSWYVGGIAHGPIGEKGEKGEVGPPGHIGVPGEREYRVVILRDEQGQAVHYRVETHAPRHFRKRV